MQTFTSEEFTGYTFKCETASANTGFKHICKVYDKNNNEIEEAKSVVNWGNRTWESYQFASVYEQSKANLKAILEGYKKPEVDYDFLNTLADKCYIYDFGEMENGETVIIFDSWSQVEGEDERVYKEGEGMVKTGKFIKSVYAKLVELAEQNRLKPSINSTIQNVEYVFSDEYARCDECGTIHNTYYGDLTYVEEEGMLLCDKCINSLDRVNNLIDEAREDMRKALKPTIDQSIIEELGYTLVTDETFSFEKEFWGATYVTQDWVDEFIHEYDGFVQIYEVAQFVTPFQIWVRNDKLDEAKKALSEELNITL